MSRKEKVIMYVMFIALFAGIIAATPRALDQMYYEQYEIPAQEAKEIKGGQ